MLRIILGCVIILFDLFLYVAKASRGIMFEFTDMALMEDMASIENILPVLPDFIGYILIFFGMKAEQEKIPRFKQDKKFMIPFAALGYGICLGNLYGQLDGLTKYGIFGCGFLTMLAHIAALFFVARGFMQAESGYSVKIGAKRVDYVWRVFAMIYFLEVISSFIGQGEMYLVCFVAKVICGIVMTVYITQAAIVYNEFKRSNRI